MRIEEQSTYQRSDDGEGYYIAADAELVCPVCGSRLVKYGRRRRRVTMPDGERREFSIQRMRCVGKDCRRIHHVLPEGIVPYHQYTAESLEKSLTGKLDDAVCEDTTQTAWRHWFGRFEKTLENAAAKLMDVLCVRIPLRPLELQTSGWLKRIVQAAVNGTGRLSTQSA